MLSKAFIIGSLATLSACAPNAVYFYKCGECGCNAQQSTGTAIMANASKWHIQPSRLEYHNRILLVICHVRRIRGGTALDPRNTWAFTVTIRGAARIPKSAGLSLFAAVEFAQGKLFIACRDGQVQISMSIYSRNIAERLNISQERQ